MSMTIAIICFFIGLGLGGKICGHVAYEEGISDERRGWYIHAHYWNWKEKDFKKSEYESKNHI